MPEELTYKKIFYFWMPLAATWLMMSVEGPFLTAIIARLAEPKFNLAAYGVAFSFALIIEAPVIMMLSASTALVKNYHSFTKLKNFVYSLNLLLTVLILIAVIPPVFNFLAIDLIGLPPNVAHLTHIGLFILMPWPGAIGYRRSYQGILIKYNKTKRVAYGTVIRLIAMSITALILYFFTEVHGVIVGTASLSAGVIAEAVSTKFMTASILKKIPVEGQSVETDLTYKEIFNFYYPLALTALISLGVHPIVTFFIGKSYMAIESLAVLPVLNSLVFIFRSLGLSYQEVGIALMGEKMENYKSLRNFAIGGGAFVFVGMMLIANTPAADFWFRSVSGLTNELAEFASLPLRIYAFIPVLTFYISFQRAILVYARKTQPITFATTIEVGVIILILFVVTKNWQIAGVIAATIGFVFGRTAANLYLISPFRKAVTLGK
ncbi:MAG: hypothetical protein K8F36_02640 [Melioribacteraceae bacterium]|nr:hypothetical protein [Melioribacteraceae bacterium]